MTLYSILIAVNARIDPNSLKKIMTSLLFNRIDYDDVIIGYIQCMQVAYYFDYIIQYYTFHQNITSLNRADDNKFKEDMSRRTTP